MSQIASIYMVIGMRSNGKTYGALNEDIIPAVNNGEKFFYLRRKHKHIVRTKMRKLFQELNKKCLTENGFEIEFSNSLQAFIRNDTNEVVGYCGAIEDAMDKKGEYLADCTHIYFDEFIDYTYFDDEIDLFLNILSTIIRKRQSGVTIIMSANTIRKNCPYFDLFKIPISKLRSGEIMEIHHQKGAVIRVEYSKTYVQKETKGKDFYFGFDDTEKTTMILSGAWETKGIELRSYEGHGWNSRRKLIPLYISSNCNLYELSVIDRKNPVAFCRKINNTNGIISSKIRYIIGIDGREFTTSNGEFVPRYKKLSPLMDESVIELYKLFVECYKCGRIVYQEALDGTEFIYDFDDNKFFI